jgi:hypothetical protein
MVARFIRRQFGRYVDRSQGYSLRVTYKNFPGMNIRYVEGPRTMNGDPAPQLTLAGSHCGRTGGCYAFGRTRKATARQPRRKDTQRFCGQALAPKSHAMPGTQLLPDSHVEQQRASKPCASRCRWL